MIVGGKRLIELGERSRYIPVWRSIVEGLSIAVVVWFLQRYYLKRSGGVTELYLVTFVIAAGKVFHNLVMDKIIGAGGSRTMSCPIPGLGNGAAPDLRTVPVSVAADSQKRQSDEQQRRAQDAVDQGISIPTTDAISGEVSYGGGDGARGFFGDSPGALSSTEYFPTNDYVKAPSKSYGIRQRSDNPVGYTSFTY